MKKYSWLASALLTCFCCSCFSSRAQLAISAQIRPRAEFRNGQGAPLPKDVQPAIFISQRTRLNLSYAMPRLKLGLSLQDVRVWGQDVSTINATTTQNNNGLMLHEAWAEILLSDTATKTYSFSVKIGRQELIYDDQRLLGNLDWLQQARRHDAAVLKFENKVYVLHLGAAFNQNQQNASGTIYNPLPPGNYPASTNSGTMYKSMEFLYAQRKLTKGTISFLYFADQFSKYHPDSSGNLKIYQTGAWSRNTTGFYFNNSFGNLQATASAYYQFGKNANGQNINAILLSGSLQYQLTKQFFAGGGIDYTSGGANASKTNSFDPLYGTPHKFWGLMDYFYAASPFGNGGLSDYYIKTKLKPSENFWLTADLHQFSSAAKVTVPSDPANTKKSFGQEMDIVGSYNLTKQISFEAGYSHFFCTSLLTSPSVKNIPNAKNGADWAYLMINIRPEFLFK